MCPQLNTPHAGHAQRIAPAPAIIERHTVKPRTPEWFALRAQDLTMSEVGAVAGVDPYATAYEIWARKMGLAAPPEENAAMRLGRWAEPAVACALQEQHPEYQIDYPLNIYVRDPDIRLGGTPDATGFEHMAARIVFEFKVISRASFEANWSNGPPLGYQLQTLGNAMLLEADYGVLAALVLGWQDAELVVHRVERNERAEAGIRSIAASFWAAFDDGHAPVAPDYARDADVLRQVFKPDPDKPAPLDLSTDNRLGDMLAMRAALKAEIKEDEATCKEIDAEIVHKLNGSESATLPGWKISHTMAHRDAYQVAAKDYPVLKVTKAKDAA
jgi:predicted phage-related endonuclease